MQSSTPYLQLSAHFVFMKRHVDQLLVRRMCLGIAIADHTLSSAHECFTSSVSFDPLSATFTTKNVASAEIKVITVLV